MTTIPSDASDASDASRASHPATVTVTVNGACRDVRCGATLDELVADLTAAPSGVAAAVNEAVVPRGEWPRRRLADGDRVEVLTAVQGG